MPMDANHNALLECVPNFSEGRNKAVIDALVKEIEHVEQVKVLHTDMGYDANRTVITFAGNPQQVCEAAFRAIALAAKLIDMRQHTGAHPRIGATDVCPLVPISGITIEQTVALSVQLAERVGNELGIPVYLYERSALLPERKNLANCRSGQYEGLAQKLASPLWKPDFGPQQINVKAGATVIGARHFLIAYNVTLNTTNTAVARQIAATVRESGYSRTNNQNGTKSVDNKEHNIETKVPGLLKAVKAIGWLMPEYGKVQVSTNIVDYRTTPLHVVFETIKAQAALHNVQVSGSELIGLIPMQAMVEAGTFYLKQTGFTGLYGTEQAIAAAVKHLALDDLAPFIAEERIIERVIAG